MWIIYNVNNHRKFERLGTNPSLSVVHWSRCIICPPGKVQPSPGQTSCTDCAAGKYQEKQGQTSCKDCSEAEVQPLAGQTSCSTCPVGKEKKTAAQACADCAIGRYQDETSTDLWLTCRNCNPGAYQNEEGQTSCKACPIGKGHDANSIWGATSLSTCEKCDPGKFSLDYTIRYHRDNAYNTHTVSQSECKALASAAGYSFQAACNTNPGFSAEGCFRVAVGSRYEFNTCGGAKCNVDSWVNCVSKNFPSERPCEDCGVDEYQDEEGQSSCKECASGFWSDEGSATCTTCYAGKYISSSKTCSSCGTGKYQNEDGKSGCKNCPVYHYQDTIGQDHCHMCPRLKAQTKTGQSSCVSNTNGQHLCTAFLQLGAIHEFFVWYACPYAANMYPYQDYYPMHAKEYHTRPDYP